MGVLFRHGLLSSRDQSSIKMMIDQYPYPVLLSKHIDYNWIEKNLSIHTRTGEDCMGQDYDKQTHLYGIVTTAVGPIYFFYDKGDFEKVCALPDIVLDPQPFMTFLEGTVLDKIFK